MIKKFSKQLNTTNIENIKIDYLNKIAIIKFNENTNKLVKIIDNIGLIRYLK